MRTSMEDRITALEMKAAHQEHTIEQLNEIVTVQQKQLNDLEKLYQKLREKVIRMNEQLDQLPENERPPHY